MGSPCRDAPRQGLTAPASSKFPDLTLHDPWIRQILEMIKENNRFTQRTHTIHLTPPLSESETSIDSATNGFVTAFFTRLPWENAAKGLSKFVWDL